MTKLAQILAVEKGTRNRAHVRLTDIHRKSQQTALLSGIIKTYEPRDDEGERLPGESTAVQVTGEQILKEIAETLHDLFNVTATKDAANTEARGDVIVYNRNGDPTTLLRDVPVTTLLFLEKQLADIRTMIAKIPTLDPAERWSADVDLSGEGVYRTETTFKTRSRKVPKNHVKAKATDKHPEQVEVFFEDQVVGDWGTTKFSGAFPVKRQRELLRRVDELERAVKFARESANGTEVTDERIAEPLFGYLFSPGGEA